MSNINDKFLKALPEQPRQYYKTHFTIESGYKWGEGMAPELRDRFFGEMIDLFSKAGWEVQPAERSSICPTVRKDGNELYCHPMELSGPCEEHLQEEVMTLLNFAENCQLVGVVVSDQVYSVSDEQYFQALNTVRGDIEKDLMSAFDTGSRMRFFPGYYDKVDDVAYHYYIKTLDRPTGISSDDPHMKYIHNVFHDLIQQGKIICKANDTHGKLYRTATGPELLELARKQASLESMIQNANQRTDAHQKPTHQPTSKTRS